jgi:hypothetical protein
MSWSSIKKAEPILTLPFYLPTYNGSGIEAKSFDGERDGMGDLSRIFFAAFRLSLRLFGHAASKAVRMIWTTAPDTGRRPNYTSELP